MTYIFEFVYAMFGKKIQKSMFPNGGLVQVNPMVQSWKNTLNKSQDILELLPFTNTPNSHGGVFWFCLKNMAMG